METPPSCSKVLSSAVKQLCYCCQETPSSTLLWHQGGTEEESYGQTLQDCYSMQLDGAENDVICVECVDQLHAAVKFKHQVIAARNQMQQTLDTNEYSDDLEELKPGSNVKLESDVDDKGDIDDKSDIGDKGDVDHVVTLESVPVKEETKKPRETKTKKNIVNKEDFTKVDQKYVCKKCKKTLSNYRSIIRHLNCVHYKAISLTERNEKIRTKTTLDGHKLKAGNTCDSCAEKFKTAKQFSEHKKVCDIKNNLRKLGVLKDCLVPLKKDKVFPPCNTNKDIKKNSSPVVSSQILDTSTPKETQRSKYKVLPGDYTKIKGQNYKCNICQRTLTNTTSILRHINNVHYKNAVYPCPIPLCDTKVITLYNLIQHKFNAHNIDERVTCNVCDKKFWTSRDLSVHNDRYHKLGQKRKCPECDYEAFSLQALQNHMFKHNTNTKYPCSYCSKVFTRKDSHRYHERIHTGDKRKVCKICDARFVQRTSLKHHIMKHHPNAPTT